MRLVIPLYLSIIVTASCSGGTTAQPVPAAPGNEPALDAAIEPDVEPGAIPADNHPPEPGRPSHHECERLLDHVIELGRAAHAPKVAPDQVPTDEQVAKIREGMAREFLPSCQAMERAMYECALNATTRDELAACETSAQP